VTLAEELERALGLAVRGREAALRRPLVGEPREVESEGNKTEEGTEDVEEEPEDAEEHLEDPLEDGPDLDQGGKARRPRKDALPLVLLRNIQGSTQPKKTAMKRKVKTTLKEANTSDEVDDEEMEDVNVLDPVKKKPKRFLPNARCGVCDKKISYVRLKKHMMADHPEVGLETVKCIVCGKHVVEVMLPQHMAGFHGR
jgi:DNA-directed RNA polymerase subunit M/transcription elongation factor TFIIS